MKSKISLFNKAVAKRNFTGGWWLWASAIIFYLLFLPVRMYGELSTTLRMEGNSQSELLELARNSMILDLWNCNFVTFFAVIALACAMFVFAYLFTGRNSNMMHTYPVNRYSLFVTNYVTGLLFAVVPVIVCTLLTLGVGASLGVINGAIVKYYFIWMAAVFVENMFFYSMSVCVLMFVGNMIAVPVLYFILNFLYEGCLIIAEAILSSVCYGLQSFSLSRKAGAVLTPIAFMSRIRINTNAEHPDFQFPIQNMNALPGYFAVAVLFVAIALIAYQKKHIETAGDVITVNWLKPIFRWGAAICTSALGALFFSSIFYNNSFIFIIISVVVVGVLVFFVAQMLLERSIHVFTKRKIQECALYTLLICICYFALNMDVIGLERKIPDRDEIKAMQVRGDVNLFAVNEEEISWAYDIHSQIIASRKEFKKEVQESNFRSAYVRIEYLLNDGTVFRRVYDLPLTEKAENIAKQIMDYERRPEIQLKQLFGVHYPNVEIFGGTWYNYSNEYGDIRISQSDARQLYQAAVQDIQSGRLDGTEEKMDERNDTVETIEKIGEITLEVRDEAGYLSILDGYGLDSYHIVKNMKEGQAHIYLDQRFTSLMSKMEELGMINQEGKTL